MKDKTMCGLQPKHLMCALEMCELCHFYLFNSVVNNRTGCYDNSVMQNMCLLFTRKPFALFFPQLCFPRNPILSTCSQVAL